MTLNEFRAWLDGFCAATGEPPNAEQWTTIRATLAKVGEPAVLGLPMFPPGKRGGMESDRLDVEFAPHSGARTRVLSESGRDLGPAD